MALEWKRDLETGFERIDDQHKLILTKLAEFQEACEEGLGTQIIRDLFDFIERYVREHFALEEAYMYGKRYPQFEEHRARHHALRAEYKKIHDALAEGQMSPSLVAQANFFLSDWWQEHICHVDKTMVEFTKLGKKSETK